MQRLVLVCAAISFGLSASPAAAQQADAAPTGQAPPAPDAYQLPPPPPFPPMPKTDPHHRWVDTGDHRSGKRHQAARTSHRASTAHHSKTRASRSKARVHQSKTTPHASTVHLSRKMIRQCHAMSYKQIMKHSNCRSLMRQELAAADHQRATAHRHKSKTARHHSTKRRKK